MSRPTATRPPDLPGGEARGREDEEENRTTSVSDSPPLSGTEQPIAQVDPSTPGITTQPPPAPTSARLSDPTPPPSTDPTPSLMDQPFRHYKRGDMILPVESSSGTTKWVLVSPSRPPALIVSNDQMSSTNPRVEDHGEIYSALSYAASILGLGSLLWLLLSSVLATASLSSHLRDPSNFLGSPNSWEIGLFVVYIQGVASISHLTITPTVPPSLLAFADAFSWTAFVPLHAAATGMAHQLDQVVLEGLVAFAGRIGVHETDLIYLVVGGFAVLLCTVVVIVFSITFFLARHRGSDETRRGTSTSPSSHETASACSLAGRIVAGVATCVWFISLYPLALASSYEIAMQTRSSDASRIVPMALAVAMLVGCCGGGLVASCIGVSRLRSEDAMHEPRAAAVWGSLYDGVRVERRLFFAAIAVVQLVRGVVIGMVVDARVQLGTLVALDGAILLAIALLQPFTRSSPIRLAAPTVFLLRLGTTVLLFIFMPLSSSWATRRVVAMGVVIACTTILLLWFARHVWFVGRLLRHGSTQRDSSLYESEYVAAAIRTPSPSRESDAFHCEGPYATHRHDHTERDRARHEKIPYSSIWDHHLP